jgi:hypothetical protein
MQFIVMHKVDAQMEAGAPPDQDIISKMGALVQESLKNGVMINGAGLHPSSQRVRARFAAEKRSLTKGPLAGENELVAALFMIKARSMAGALELAEKFAEVLGDVEIEIGPVVEPWDLGMIPKPARRDFERFLLLCKGNLATESGAEDATARAALAALEQRLTEEGILLMAEHLAPSARGARLAAGPAGKRSWVDGPFAESKELIAGFSILELPARSAALAWAERYAAILHGNEVDVRELAGAR